MNVSKTLTDSTSIKKQWLTDIAPKYLDLDNVNMYQSGALGLMLEILSTTTEDSRQAAGFARREFYPTVAQNYVSFYKMAALQQISLPMAKPATVRAILIMEEKTIINKGEVSGDMIKFVIDNNVKLMIGDRSFMLDFPIVILAKRISGSWTYVTHYDVTTSNSLSNSHQKYLKNKVHARAGERLLFIDVELHQVTLEFRSEPITKNASIDVVTMDFKFQGQLASFEAFYKESDGTNEVQLLKVLKNSITPKSPFCMYTLVNNNTLRLHFPSNIYFTPRFNSLLNVYIYTTLGTDGNFDKFEGSIASEVKSEKYPYSNGMFLSGITNGSSWGGCDMANLDDFKRTVMFAYATNDTITTENDLQILFDKKNTDTNARVIFFKRRDDVFERRYGAFVLMKDKDANVIPTNTLSIKLPESDYDAIYEPTSTCIIRPGRIFRYESQSKDIVVLNKDLTLSDDLNPYDEANNFLYTNPFLISVTKYPNTVGFFLNSIDSTVPLDYSQVNDNSFFQFLVSKFHIYRNAIVGQNYYKIYISISPSTVQDDFQYTIFDDINWENNANYIRALEDGVVTSIRYADNAVYATVKYTSGLDQRIQISSYVDKDENGVFHYHDGWNFNYEVGDTFLKNNILAKKKIHDRGKLRLIGVMRGSFDSYERYFPLVLEDFNKESNYYTFAAYLSTEDLISGSNYLVLEYGVKDKHGNEVLGGALITYEDVHIDTYVFYKYDDKNYPHDFNEYDYCANYTMTNGYAHDNSDQVDILTPLRYIRSTLTMTPMQDVKIEANPVMASINKEIESGLTPVYGVINKNMIPGDVYSIYRTTVSGSSTGLRHSLTEVPLVRSNWIKNSENCSYFIEKIRNLYMFLQDAYEVLENNFTIDMKFTNTYGYSKFTRVGIKDDMRTLDRVNLTLHIGVHLNILSSFENFKNRFVTFVKDYIEDINTNSQDGKQIYIMNLMHACKAKFEEIEYLEYYGINEYDEKDVQKIDSLGSVTIHQLGYEEYIPEFVNIYSLKGADGIVIPQIDVYPIE